MEAIRRVLWLVHRPAMAISGVSWIAALALLVLGEGSLAALAGTAGMFFAIPLALVAQARPRPGLVWYGSYAEPWRAERSPGQPQEGPDDAGPGRR